VSTIRSRGFTLLELLVVMVIIGIIASMAVLSVGLATRDNGVEKELQRIQDLIGLASEEAVAQGREFGLTFYGKEYEFSAWDAAEAVWKPLGEDARPFVPHTFAPGTIVDLEIEGRIVKIAEERPVVTEQKDKTAGDKQSAAGKSKSKVNDKDKDKDRPQVFMDSSGEVTPPFKLRLRPGIGSPGISLRVSESGKVEQVRDAR